VKERGVVKGFYEPTPQKKPRIWVGIALHPSPDDIVGAPQKSCKHEGVVENNPNYPKNSKTFPRKPLTEGVLENQAKVGGVGKEGLTWSEDGVEWEYIPVEESE